MAAIDLEGPGGVGSSTPYQLTVLAVLVVTGAVAAVGLLAGLASLTEPVLANTLAAAGLAGVGVALTLSRHVDVLQGRASADGGTLIGRRHAWNRLKTATVTLKLLTLAGLLVLVELTLVRTGAMPMPLEGRPDLATRMALGLSLALLVAALATVRLSLRDTPSQSSNRARRLLAALVAAALVASAALSVAAHTGLGVGLGLEPADAPLLLLAASVATAALVFPSRSVPTLPSLLSGDHRDYHGPTHLSRSEALMVPVTLGLFMALVAVLVVLAAVYGVGVIVPMVAASPTLQIVVGGLGLASLVGLVATVVVDINRQHHGLRSPALSRRQRIQVSLLVFSILTTTLIGAAAAVLALEGSLPYVAMAQHHWIDLVAVALLFATGPWGVYLFLQERRAERMEARFPEFLRDLAAGRKAGLTLENSVMTASKGNYDALTPEVRRMADQLSWNVPFEETLEKFHDRLGTPLVERAVSLIREASRSGGNVTHVLQAAANDVREVQALRRERHSHMVVYTSIVYIAFLVFLGVIAILYTTLVPEILRVTSEASTAGSGSLQGLNFHTGLVLTDFRIFYFVAALVQAVGNGLMAGLLAKGRLRSGLLHAAVMVLIALVAFALL